MLSEHDEKHLDDAFHEAERAQKAGEVPVGCIFVHPEQGEICRGRNKVNELRDPTQHAELVAITELESRIGTDAARRLLSESTLYVSLEPCIMCGAALQEVAIRRIVYGASNPRFGGIRSIGSWDKYVARPKECEIVSDVAKERSIALLKMFYDGENPAAPPEKRKIKKRKTEVVEEQ